jgi:superfamily I DNA/RNA helicase
VTANSKDDHSLLRILNVPRRGFGQTTIRKIDEYARTEKFSILDALGRIVEGAGDFSPTIRVASGHVSRLFERAKERLSTQQPTAMAKGLIEEASYLEAVTELYPDPLTRQCRWAAVEELLRSLEEWEKHNRGGDFSDFLSALTLDRDDSRSSDLERRQGVRLMTLHSAKGLEFPHVFLVGLEDDLLPHKRALAEGERAIEEERRLLYVGITRAQRTLTLTHARTRTQFGQTRERKPSRFLLEVADRKLFDSESYDPNTEASESDVQGFLEMYRGLKGNKS